MGWDLGGLVKVDFFVIATISIYVIVIMFVGWWSSRKVHDMTDFLVAGRKLPYWMATATLLATWFGAGSSMGVAGAVYKGGLHSVVADPFGAAVSLLIAGFFYVAILRRMRLLTITDIVERAYGKRAGIYSSLWMVPVFIGWLGTQIMGIGKILKLLFGVDEVWGDLLGALIVLIYTYAGGMWAVTLTDVVQVVLIIFGLSLVLPGAVGSVGGLSELIHRIPAADLSLLPPADPEVGAYNTWVAYIGQWVMMGLGCVIGQDLIQRSLASKSPAVARRSAITSGFGYLAIGLIPITIGFCARYINWNAGFSMDLFASPGSNVLADPDTVIPVMAVQIMPAWLLALFLSALVSAIMSSADSSLLAATSLVTNNVVRPCFPSISDRKLLAMTRFSTVVVLAVSLLIAFKMESMYSLLVNSWASQLLVTFIPVTTALYFPRVGRTAAWWSMVVGPVVWIGYTFYSAGFRAAGAGMNGVVMCLACGFMAAAAVWLLGPLFRPNLLRRWAWCGIVAGGFGWTVATSFYCPTFALNNIDDSMLSRGAMYGFVAALLAVIVVALLSPRRVDEPRLWVPLSDDSVPPELERAAQNDKLMPPPILG
ncbi:MAG: sodium:solute symporter family protein [Victivallaceae bacterium]|nr:sodium:solute symporter family protein [Victivallaceae bacterium]